MGEVEARGSDERTDDFVSTLICTRNRPQDAVRAARSVLASVGVMVELIIVDQSDGQETAEALSALSDSRLRYQRSDTRGLGAALDEGVRLARSSYVVHTDDDCVVPPEWAAGMASALAEDPDVGMVFCSVDAAAYDPRSGYIPAYTVSRARVLHSVLSTCRGRGLGAGVAFRREAVLAVGGIDSLMGAGGSFHSCEDWDIELRMLLRGWKVVHTPDVAVLHYGFRTFAEGREHAVRDWLGIGACLGKLVRAGQPSALILAAWELTIHAVLPPIGDLLRLRRPKGLRRIVSFGRGFAQGFRAAVDRSTLRFATDLP